MSMTKSKTSSLSNDNNIQAVLANYLRGQCTLRELQERLRDYIIVHFDSATGQREIQDLGMPESIKIQVTSDHLRYMLQEFIDQKISKEELSDWAAFIYMTTFYVPEGETEEARWQSGEGVLWEIIQNLADPNKFASLNLQIAQDYLKLL